MALFQHFHILFPVNTISINYITILYNYIALLFGKNAHGILENETVKGKSFNSYTLVAESLECDQSYADIHI